MFTSVYCFAQQQSADDEGGTQAVLLKKLAQKAKYGANSIQNTVTFGTAKGINGDPVVAHLSRARLKWCRLKAMLIWVTC